MDYSKNNYACKEKELKAVMVENTTKDYNHNMELRIENIEAKDGSLTAKIKKNNTDALLIHSLYNPHKEAEQMISNLDFSRHGLFLVFGLGLAYHIDLILKKASGRSKIIIIEQSKEVFDNAMKNIDMTDILKDKRVIVFIGIHAGSIPLVLESFDKENSFLINYAHSMQVLELNYNKIIFNNANDVVGAIARITQLKWKMLGNCQVDHNIGVIQPVLNIDHVMENPGIDSLREKYKDKACIIVSAGPSLDKNIQLLHNLKGKVVVFAVDSVFPKLLKNGIIPDFIATVERLSVYNNIFKNMEESIPKEVTLIAPALTEVKTFERFKDNNKIIFFPEGVGTQEYFNNKLQKGLMATGTSVSYTSMNAAKAMGFSKIAFIGQDLAYGKDGSIYCREISKKGNEVENERRKDQSYIAWVKDYDGNPIESNFLWKDQLIAMEYFIKANSEIEFYDATEGGAKIEGTKIITLEDYLKKISDQTVEDVNVLLEKEKKLLMKDDKARLLEELRQYIKSSVTEYRALYDKIKKHFERLDKEHNSTIVNRKAIDQKEADKIIEIINYSAIIVKTIEDDKFLKLYYQALIAIIKKEANELPEDNYREKLKEHIRIHHEFFSMIKDTFLYNLEHMVFIEKFLEDKINGRPVERDIINILREITQKAGINPEFLYDYFGEDTKASHS